MTHLLQPPEPIQVECTADGLPVEFHWQGRAQPIVEICNHWRLQTGWWQDELASDTYKVLTAAGLLCLIVHDRRLDQWWLERVYE